MYRFINFLFKAKVNFKVQNDSTVSKLQLFINQFERKNVALKNNMIK